MSCKTIKRPSSFRPAFSIKCGSCKHSQNYTLIDLCDSLGPISIDCEMVGVTSSRKNALARTSIVDYHGELLYDVMVRPKAKITDYRTPWSGIRPSDMNRALPFEVVQSQVARIIENRTIIGHTLMHDFRVLGLPIPFKRIRDLTSAPVIKQMVGLPRNSANPIGLKKMTNLLFGICIQSGEHCSIEDARAAMAAYRLVENEWERLLLTATPPPTSINQVKLKRTVSYAAFSSDAQYGSSNSKRSRLDRKELTTTRHSLLSSRSPSPTSFRRHSTTTSSLLFERSLLHDDFWPDDDQCY